MVEGPVIGMDPEYGTVVVTYRPMPGTTMMTCTLMSAVPPLTDGLLAYRARIPVARRNSC